MVRTGNKGGGGSTCPTQSVKDLDKKINQALKSIHKKVVFVAESKDVCDETLHKTSTLIDKVKNDKKLTIHYKQKLKTTCKSVLTDTQDEAEAIREALQAIGELRRLRAEKRIANRQSGAQGPPLRRGALMVMLQQYANTLPLWVGEMGQKPPALCGSIAESADYSIEPGASVAALVNGGDDEEHNWILAEVRTYSAASGKYSIEDVDEEQPETYTVGRSKLIPLPVWRANPTTDSAAIFPENAIVLALYPQTTCFYKGVVEQTPATPHDDYLVAFEDASFPGGYSPPMPVPQRYLVTYKHFKQTPRHPDPDFCQRSFLTFGSGAS